jgi:hypothetical protein
MLPAMTSGTSASPVADAVIRIGASRSFAPRNTSAGPNSSPSSLEVLEMADHEDPVAGADLEHRQKTDE